MTKTTIPAAALSQHMAVLGKTGSGKSYAMRGIVEQLLNDKARVCVIDPTGAWYGLRTLADGKHAGYPVAIFGGSHADFPLAAQHGEELAEIIGTSSTPAILDVSLLRTGERTRLFTDFAEGLLRKNRGPLHLVIDEAHLFAPQGRVNDPQSGAMLHAANNLVSLGRSRGLRIVLITQRPAKLHKDSLTQVETLVAMRLIAPQDRKAVEEWIKDNTEGDQGRQILSSLATLKTGQGWVWAPELGVLERVQFPTIRTFDSGRAPDLEGASGPVLAPIDREAIAGRLKAVAQDAIDNDPKRLRAKIAELERQISQHKCPVAVPHSGIELEEARLSGIRSTQQLAHEAQKDLLASLRKQIESAVGEILERAQPLPVAAPPAHIGVKVTVPAKRPWQPETAPAIGKMIVTAAVSARGRATGARTIDLSGAARKILAVLAQFPEGCASGKLTLLTGYRYTGTFRNALSELRTAGLLEGDNGSVMRITDAGQAQGPFEELPQGQELLRYWLNQPNFTGAARKILAELQHGEQLTAAALCKATGYEYTGTFRNALSELRTAGVLVGRNTEAMRISPEIVP